LCRFQQFSWLILFEKNSRFDNENKVLRAYNNKSKNTITMKTTLVVILILMNGLAINAQEVIYYCGKSTAAGATWQVYKKNLTSGITDTITNDPAYNYWKVELSPNYKELLMLRSPVSSSPDQENYAHCDIIKSNADGGNLQVIVADNQHGWYAFGNPHWHPSGNRILIIAQATDSIAPWYVYTIDTLGNNPKQLTTQWSIFFRV